MTRNGTGVLPVAAGALSLLLVAAAPARNPDWPCAQRLVPVLSFGQFWAGPAPAADWRSDPQIAELVRAVAPRSVALDTAVAKLRAFSDALPETERPAKLPMTFAGLVDETSQQREEIIDRIKSLGRRQRDVEGVVAKLNTELAEQPDADAAGRADATRQRDLVIRMFQDTQRTLRYACEIPTALEARLGRFAEALQAALPK
ncbi:MAG: hypothetical protein JOY63_14985 [Acetobacteraceae bacterium]|nr:hypothetical protein [Acetobacteraceae bacterium]